MRIMASYYSACGKRTKNEDSVSLLETPDNVLALAADGLGGHVRGDEASRLAIREINAVTSGQKQSEETLRKAILRANEAIRNHPECRIMRTTIAALWIEADTALLATVGDTRIYHFRDGRIIYQTKDHSMSQMAVLMGEITEEQIRSHHERNRLVRALGAQEELRVDMEKEKLQPGDAFLLCTDGFWENVLEQDMINDLLVSQSTNEWLQRMRIKAETRGTNAEDNHSAIAIFVR